jgi:hypothetical protein
VIAAAAHLTLSSSTGLRFFPTKCALVKLGSAVPFATFARVKLCGSSALRSKFLRHAAPFCRKPVPGNHAGSEHTIFGLLDFQVRHEHQSVARTGRENVDEKRAGDHGGFELGHCCVECFQRRFGVVV